VEQVLKRLVRQVRRLAITRGEDQAIDGTSIKTRLRSDPDAGWSWDATKKEYYGGYGLLLVACPLTHLPLAVVLTDGKHATSEQTIQALEQARQTFQPRWIIGDGEFDPLGIHSYVLSHGAMPVIKYNPRNT